MNLSSQRISTGPVTSLGHQEGAKEFSEKGRNYVQHIFQGKS